MLFNDLGSLCAKKENTLIAVIATVLTASSVIPIWIVRFPPLQDYPVHLLRENIIENYSNPSFQYHSSFVVSLFPIPYIFTDYIVCLLTLLLSIELAGKIMLTSYIVLLPFSAFHLILAVDRNKIPLVLWSYLFIYNRHFTKGNTSYIFSFPFLLIALGYWWKHRARLRWMNVAIFSVLVLCVYLSHLYTFIVLMFSVAVLLFIEFRGIRSPIRTVLPFLPSLILLTISFFLQARQFKAGILPSFGRDPIVIEYPTVKARLKMIVNKNLNMPYLSTFSPWRQKRVLISAAVLFALLLLGSIPTLQKNAFFWLTVALCLLSVVLPSFISPEWDISLRVLILILFIAPLCLKLPKSPRFRALLVALLSFLSLYTLGGIIKDYLLVSSILQDYYSVMKQIPAGERASFRTAKSEMYVGDITPIALFGSYYYIWQGANRADDAGGILTGAMRSVVYRHSENPPSRFESSISTTSVDPGGYAFILFRNQHDLVNTVMARHGFELIWQTHSFGLYHKAKSIPAVHSVPAVDWIRGTYYIVGLKTNYNYLFLWQDPARIDPAIAQHFEFVSSQGRAQLWKRRHILTDASAVELCASCGDEPTQKF